MTLAVSHADACPGAERQRGGMQRIRVPGWHRACRDPTGGMTSAGVEWFGLYRYAKREEERAERLVALASTCRTPSLEPGAALASLQES